MVRTYPCGRDKTSHAVNWVPYTPNRNAIVTNTNTIAAEIGKAVPNPGETLPSSAV